MDWPDSQAWALLSEMKGRGTPKQAGEAIALSGGQSQAAWYLTIPP